MRLCGAGAGTGAVLRKGAVLGNGAGMRVRVRFAGAGAGAVMVRVKFFAHFGVCLIYKHGRARRAPRRGGRPYQ